MRVSVIGSGYVGLVSGAGLAESGHQVLCMDIDAARIERLRALDVPIYEPGLEHLIEHNAAEGRLRFSASMPEAVAHAEVLLVAVGTPPGEDGSADLSHVLAVASSIGELAERPLLVVVKSTVPVGTCKAVRSTIMEGLSRRGAGFTIEVASNPEFLAEGRAVEDFMRPDRIIIGVDSASAEKRLRALYGPFNRNHEKILAMDVASSELTKYAANAMLATKISLMNEVANIAAGVGADVEQVRRGIGSDPRIGYAFIYPGPGYGGSCFPKDVRALAHTARGAGVEPRMLEAVEAVNQRQKERLFALLSAHFQDRLAGLTVAVWGLAFKPGTDDLREAPSLVLLHRLLAAGVRVRAHDPEAMEHARALFPGGQGIEFCADPMAAARGADALVLVTEWKQYWVPDFAALAGTMRQRVLFDGRNIWSRDAMAEHGFTCHSIGRPPLLPGA